MGEVFFTWLREIWKCEGIRKIVPRYECCARIVESRSSSLPKPRLRVGVVVDDRTV